MAAFGKTIFRQTGGGARGFYCRLLILAFTAGLAQPALAQPGPLFFRTDYSLDYSLSQATGLVIADLNNDGKLDFVVGAGYGINVAPGNGDGTFQPFTSFIPTGGGVGSAEATLASAAADFDGDGNPDLVLYGGSAIALILPGRGDGTFGPGRLITTPLVTGGVLGLQIADLNRDGRPDLVFSSENLFPVLSNVTVLLNNGDGTFSARIAFNFPSGENGLSVAIADFNRDGVPDLAVTTESDAGLGGHVYIALGKGDGSFAPPVAAATLNLAGSFITAADFNHDGTPDLAVESAYSFTTSIFLGNGDGSFRTAPNVNLGAANPGSIAVADWTKSGNLGLGIYSILTPPGVKIMGGNGDGTFYAAGTAAFDPQSLPAYQFSTGDLNGDSAPDLVALAGNTVSVLVNAGSSPPLSFVPESAASGIMSVAPASIATIYAQFPLSATQASGALPTPVELAGVTVSIGDSAGVNRPAPLFYVSPTQINLEIPAGTAPGRAVVMVTSSGPPVQGITFAQNVVPAIFVVQSSAFPAAYAITYGPDNQPQPPCS